MPTDRIGYPIQRDKGEHNDTGRERTPQQRLDFGGDVEAGQPTSGNTTKRRTRTGTLPPPWETNKSVFKERQDGSSREGCRRCGRVSCSRRTTGSMAIGKRVVSNGRRTTTDAMLQIFGDSNRREGKVVRTATIPGGTHTHQRRPISRER